MLKMFLGTQTPRTQVLVVTSLLLGFFPQLFVFHVMPFPPHAPPPPILSLLLSASSPLAVAKQVVMCSNCGRAGVIQSVESLSNRSMFFCSCGTQVVPATPAQLLTALSRGAATVASAAAAAAGEAASQHPGAPRHVSTVKYSNRRLKYAR